MVFEVSSSSTTDLDAWLESLGFTRGNPFATSEADQERTLLPEFFVDVEGYEAIKGSQSVVVFAPRGSGKSALRVVLASAAAPLRADSATLAVEYTDFDFLLSKQRAGELLGIEDHLSLLMRSGVRALLETYCGDILGTNFPEDSPSRVDARKVRTSASHSSNRALLALFIKQHYPTLLEPHRLCDYLQQLFPSRKLEWGACFNAATVHELYDFVKSSDYLTEDPRALFLAELNDFLPQSSDTATSPMEQLSTLIHIARRLGFFSVQFLVDRLDEYQDTVNDPEAQADLLAPLLAHLPILELPGVAFKFFLSREARDELLERTAIRRDRLADQAITVRWTEEKLKHLLDERLDVFSEGQVKEMVQICDESAIVGSHASSDQRLGAWIEAQLLLTAHGSPRRLLTAANLLCRAHISRKGTEGLVEPDDWDIAHTELMQRMPPTLKIHREFPVAFIGTDRKKLTANEHAILLTLVQHRGHCTRDELAEAVWGFREGVTEEAIDAAISRLRRKLGDSSSNPVYLETVRGGGFVLRQYEVE